MTIPWLKLYLEARTDAKLRSLNDHQHRVWFNLFLYSGEQKKRGTIDGHKEKLLALEVAGGNVELLRETIALLTDLEIVRQDDDGLTFINFAKRQAQKPSDLPEAVAERKQKSRAKGRDTSDQASESRACHAHVTPQSRHEIRSEENRVEGEERGDRAHARDAASPSAPDEGASLRETDLGEPPAPRAGHTFTEDQVAQLRAALPADQLLQPWQVPAGIRQAMGALIERRELTPESLERFVALNQAQMVAWCCEGLRRAVLADRPAVWRFAYAAKQIGRAAQNGVDLMADGWTAPGDKVVQGPWKEGANVANKPSEDFTGWRSLLKGQAGFGDDAWVVRMADHFRRDRGFNINPTFYLELCLEQGRDVALQALWKQVEAEAQEVRHG